MRFNLSLCMYGKSCYVVTQTRGYVLKFKTRLPRRPPEYAEPRSTPNFDVVVHWFVERGVIVESYDDNLEGFQRSLAHPRRHLSFTNPCTTTTSRPSRGRGCYDDATLVRRIMARIPLHNFIQSHNSKTRRKSLSYHHRV